jgi:branched-chain amino acid transport system substrate-binding protein
MRGTRQRASSSGAHMLIFRASGRRPRPDVIFYGGLDATAGPMLRQMKQLGIAAKFIGGDGICSTELSKLAGNTMADGQVICAEAGGVEGAQKMTMESFRADFKKKYNADFQIYAPYAYGATRVLINAMVVAQSTDPAKYLPALAKTSAYKSVTGTIAFDEKGDQGRSPHVVHL